ncbi:MAG: type I restriction enzyme HsdR N-terminal domain-containing protein [Bacteroidales bacterium]|nr:type I restriction enzyme HsdR N-terminal domain-containing protein [Bacteroidales bacterium]
MDTTNIQVREQPDGRCEVLDPVRKRWVALTPEEEVRQQTIRLLHHRYGYPLELMQVEGAITVNGQTRRCDIVVYSTSGQPRLIVECKRPDVPINQKVCDQACRYNTVLQVPLLLLTNGRQQIIIEIDYHKRSLRQLADLPFFLNNVNG